jgi:hypothetical protein
LLFISKVIEIAGEGSMDEKKTRIEANPEIEALLKALMIRP